MTAVLAPPRLAVPVLRPVPGGWRGVGGPGWEWEHGDRRLPVVSGGALGLHPYVNGYLNAFAKKIDVVNDAIKVLLLSSGYTPSQAHKWYSDVSGVELASANGYTAGGAALGSVTSVVVGSTLTVSGATVSWVASGAGFSTSYGAIYDSTPGTAGTDPLVAYIDFGGAETIAPGSTFNIVWSGSGIVATTVS